LGKKGWAYFAANSLLTFVNRLSFATGLHSYVYQNAISRHCQPAVCGKKIFPEKFGKFACCTLPLRQFFKNYLSRKAEGYGPMKPWQPTMKIEKVLIPARRHAGKDKSDKSFLKLFINNIESPSDLQVGFFIVRISCKMLPPAFLISNRIT